MGIESRQKTVTWLVQTVGVILIGTATHSFGKRLVPSNWYEWLNWTKSKHSMLLTVVSQPVRIFILENNFKAKNSFVSIVRKTVDAAVGALHIITGAHCHPNIESFRLLRVQKTFYGHLKRTASLLHKYRHVLKAGDRFKTLKEIPFTVQKEQSDTKLATIQAQMPHTYELTTLASGLESV